MEAYRLTLLEVLEERRARNPAYSLRAFAGSCGVSPATMSQILSGKRPLTVKSAKRIAERLALAPDERSRLVRSAGPKRAEREDRALGAREEIDLDRFKAIADWHHYAILSLSELPGHQATPEWIAAKLGIPVSEARAALERLARLGLLTIERRKMRQVPKALVTPHDVPSAALRRHHRQVLERALKALESVPVQWRDFGTLTMAIDPARLPQAKKIIRRFRQQLAAICESGDKKAVYHFSTQFFPVTPPETFFDLKRYDSKESEYATEGR